MNIAYVGNENYARHMGVSICSLCDSNEGEELKLFVISTGIGGQSRERLKKIAGSYGREICFLELQDLSARLGGAVDTGRFDVSTMGRLFLGELLPDEVERVLYLDCDTVVVRSLRPLWERALRGAVLAAAQEPTIYPEVREYLRMDARAPYFNAGVLLIDLKLWRSENMTARSVSFYRSIERKSLFHDQDALNGCLGGRIRTLPPEWNFFTNYRYYRYSALCGMQPSYARIGRERFRRAARRPAVIHFAGDERPWKAGSLNPYGKVYDRYLGMTPWAGAPKERGQELYLLLYHAMDLVTLLLPGLRRLLGRFYVRRQLRKRRERMGGEPRK